MDTGRAASPLEVAHKELLGILSPLPQSPLGQEIPRQGTHDLSISGGFMVMYTV